MRVLKTAIALTFASSVSAKTCPGASWANAPFTQTGTDAPVAKLNSNIVGSIVYLGYPDVATAAMTNTVTCNTSLVDPVCWSATYKHSDAKVWIGGCAPSTLPNPETPNTAMTSGCDMLSKLILGAAGDGSNGTLVVQAAFGGGADTNYSITTADFSCTAETPKSCPTATMSAPVTQAVFEQTSSMKTCAEGKNAKCWKTELKSISIDPKVAGGCYAIVHTDDIDCDVKKKDTAGDVDDSIYPATHGASIININFDAYDANVDNPSVFTCPSTSAKAASPASIASTFFAVAAGIGYMLF